MNTYGLSLCPHACKWTLEPQTKHLHILEKKNKYFKHDILIGGKGWHIVR